ncbi:MAG: V-type ATP synthase subunit F [Eubacteriaceae bacterium]|jgi:V/A-type H+-transporting ATPase subunit F|nr:V-type ATP synthase subunit F [Eubacteriaceae bacterium]
MDSAEKIAVIGDRESVMIFQALGFRTIYAEKKEEINKAIHDLATSQYAVIYITEQAAATAMQTIELYKTSPYPAIIPIPSRLGTLGLGQKIIKENIEKAVGADIF